jgi:hypothetical protein
VFLLELVKLSALLRVLDRVVASSGGEVAVQLSSGLVGRLDVADVHVQVHHDDSLHKGLHFCPATEQI